MSGKVLSLAISVSVLAATLSILLSIGLEALGTELDAGATLALFMLVWMGASFIVIGKIIAKPPTRERTDNGFQTRNDTFATALEYDDMEKKGWSN